MKKLIFLLLSIGIWACPQDLPADLIEFEYDASGNCVRKVKMVVLGSARSKSAGKASPRFDEEASAASDVWSDGTELRLHPNPTRGRLLLEFRGGLPAGGYTLRLSDAKGQLLLQAGSDAPSYTLDLTDYPAGLYLLQVEYGQEVKEWKIIKE